MCSDFQRHYAHTMFHEYWSTSPKNKGKGERMGENKLQCPCINLVIQSVCRQKLLMIVDKCLETKENKLFSTHLMTLQVKIPRKIYVGL